MPSEDDVFRGAAVVVDDESVVTIGTINFNSVSAVAGVDGNTVG